MKQNHISMVHYIYLNLNQYWFAYSTYTFCKYSVELNIILTFFNKLLDMDLLQKDEGCQLFYNSLDLEIDHISKFNFDKCLIIPLISSNEIKSQNLENKDSWSNSISTALALNFLDFAESDTHEGELGLYKFLVRSSVKSRFCWESDSHEGRENWSWERRA